MFTKLQFVSWLLVELISDEYLTKTSRRSVMVDLSVYDTHVRAKPRLESGAGPHFHEEKAVVKFSCRHDHCADFRHFAEHPVIGIGRIEFGFFVALIPLFPEFDREHELYCCLLPLIFSS